MELNIEEKWHQIKAHKKLYKEHLKGNIIKLRRLYEVLLERVVLKHLNQNNINFTLIT